MTAQGYNGCSRGCRYSSYDSYDRYLGHIYRYILCLIFT
nr:MAG TPA: hypothetical protein [Bacteriophage sp.]